MTKILALSGSSRRDSLNQKLVDRAVLGAREAGADVTAIRLRGIRSRAVGRLTNDDAHYLGVDAKFSSR
jgi:multimeric flavodoxin WrbA